MSVFVQCASVNTSTINCGFELAGSDGSLEMESQAIMYLYTVVSNVLRYSKFPHKHSIGNSRNKTTSAAWTLCIGLHL